LLVDQFTRQPDVVARFFPSSNNGSKNERAGAAQGKQVDELAGEAPTPTPVLAGEV